MSRMLLVDKLSLLLSAIVMIVVHGSTGNWSVDLAAALAAGGTAVGAIVRSIIRVGQRDAQQRFLRDERDRGLYLHVTDSEKELLTAMRDAERKALL